MDYKYKKTSSRFLIYIFEIQDEFHKGMLKIGHTTVTSDEPSEFLIPNCKLLNTLAKKRIDDYTKTASIRYNLLHTELAVREFVNDSGNRYLKAFADYDVHKVLINSGYQRVSKVDKSFGKDWFKIDLEVAKKAIYAVKNNLPNILGTENVSSHHRSIILRPEQEAAIEQTLKVFKKSNTMLWNAKMRFGKTLTALELIKRSGFKRSIIITHRPVVDEGWRTDFNKIFCSQDGYRYASKKDMSDSQLPTLGEKFIYFASIQDLRGSSYVDGKFDKNDIVFDLKWDLIIVDEAHEGTTTTLGDEVIKALLKNEYKTNTKFLALSGTPFNIADKYDASNTFVWDYTMEQKAKKEWEDINFGDSNPYIDLPQLNILTYNLGRLINSSSYLDLADKAFNFTEFFRVKKRGAINDSAKIETGDDIEFIHKDDILQFLDLLTKLDENSAYPFSSPEYREQFKHTLWSVPGIKEAKALKDLMLSHNVFGCGQFNIVNVAGSEENDNALEAVKLAIKETESPDSTYMYTITLSCGKLTTGVTIPEWTGVFMLSGSYVTQATSYLQTIFRAQSPCNKDGKIKTNCYVFDFAPDRALKMVVDSLSVSRRPGETKEAEEKKLGNFINFCPIISFDGSKMAKLDSNKLMQQLKKVYVDRAFRSGFEDSSIYNDNLFKLTDDNLKDFDNLSQIIGTTKANHKVKKIDVNQQGFTNEEYERINKLKNKKKKELTEEEKKEIERLNELKKNRVKAISILRGISVRMPLLIYGADIKLDEDFKIEDFLDDKIIDPASWQEFMPKDVTKSIFKKFIQYYDKDVFVAAGRKIRNIAKQADSLEPTERIKQIAQLFSYFRNPDKETVLTPWRVVNMHLSETLGGYCFYNEEFKSLLDEPVFKDKLDITSRTLRLSDANILEINSKTGLYPLYAAYSIYRAKLKKYDDIEYTKEFLDNIWKDTVQDNIYIICKTQMAKSITRRTLAGYQDIKVNAHYFENLINTLRSGKEKNFINKIISNNYWKKEPKYKMKFNAVIGNPPYQEEKQDTSDEPVYPFFMDCSFNLAPIVSFITPARFLFNAGKTKKSWNEKMLQDEHFKVVRYFSNSNDVFPNVDIKGGVAVTLRNNYQIYPKIQFFIPIKELQSILSKVTSYNNDYLSSIINPCTKFNLEALYNIFPEYKNIIGSSGTEKRLTTSIFEQLDCFSDDLKDGHIEIKGLINNKRISKFLDITLIQSDVVLDKYKVIVPKSNGTGALGETLSTPQIILPNVGYTQSFISIGRFNNSFEAESCLKYIKTKFARCLLGTLKVTQDNPKKTWDHVPLQDFTECSDIDWKQSISDIDKQLYKKYGLDEEEIKFIEDKILKMD